MDYENKYKEALERARAKYAMKDQPIHQDLVDIFPELAESKDERIRKHLIGVVELYYGYTDEQEKKDCLAWLEKQGDLTICFFTDEFEWALGRIIAFWNQNHKDGKYDENELMSYIKVRETELVKLFTDNVCKISLSDCSEEYRKAYYDGYNKCNRDWLKIKDISVYEYNKNAEILLGGQGEQKPAEFDDTNAKRMFIKALERVEEQNNKGYKLTDCDKNSWWEDFKAYTSCIVEQKPWSEEDERLRTSCIKHIEEELERIRNDKYGHSEIISDLKESCRERINWLESLKDRVQPKLEWSEEDEKMFHVIYTDINYASKHFSDSKLTPFNKKVNWLKSLRPQNRWKPSEWQLECLGYAIEKAEKDWSPLTNNRVYLTLKALEEQLKKLREE